MNKIKLITFRAVKGSTVEEPEKVVDFLNILNVELKDRAEKDFQAMQKMKDVEQSTFSVREFASLFLSLIKCNLFSVIKLQFKRHLLYERIISGNNAMGHNLFYNES